jgi:sugar lactone lactonase YvrE
VASLAVVGVVAGLAVVLPRPLEASGSVPTPGIITTLAGGGLGQGQATAVGQNAIGLATFGTKVFIADQTHLLVRAVDITTRNETIVAGDGVAGSAGNGGPATAAEINFPWALAVNASGDLYIATATTFNNDPANLIRRVDHTTGVITSVAGGGSSFVDGGAATSTSISEVQGMSFDSSGNLFIADFDNHRIRKVDHTTGVITTVAGGGSPGNLADGIPATTAYTPLPTSVAVDSSGNLWLGSAQDPRLREVDHTSGNITTVAGTTTVNTAAACPSGPATNSMAGASGITFDLTGNPMFVTYNCVSKIVSGSYSTVAGNGSMGYLGDGGPASSATVGVPMNAVSDGSGNVYISQRDNDVVRRVDHSTQVITTFAGTGALCGRSGDGGQAAAATMCSPYAVAFDTTGNLFVADVYFNIVRKIDTGGVMTTVAGNGTRGFGGDNGPATAAQLSGPAGLAVDGAGDLFISDNLNHRVRKVDPGGTISTYAGNGTAGSTGDGGPATSAELSSPGGLALDGSGDLFIADGSIRKVTPAGTITTTWSDLNSQYGASSLAIDATGNLYGASLGGVFELSVGGTVTALTTTMSDAVAIGPQGRVVIVRHSTNQVFLLASTGLVPLAGINYPGFSGDGGPATLAWLNFPTGLAIDPNGDIFIADMGNQRVRRVQAYTAPSAPLTVHALAAGLQATVGWSPPAADGGLPVDEYAVTRHVGSTVSVNKLTGSPPPTSAIYSGLSYHTTYTFTVTASNGWATSADSAPSVPITPTIADGTITTYAGLPAVGNPGAIGQAPFSLALELPQIFVADPANAVVRTVDVNAGQETILAGNDSYGYSGDGGSALSAAMQGAGAVAECGPAGPVYIADTFNYRIRVVNGPNISTFAGTGEAGNSGDGGPAMQAHIGDVFGLACLIPDANTPALFFTDASNGVVREVDSNGNITTAWTGLIYPTGIYAIDAHTLVVVDSGSNVVWWLNDQRGICFIAGRGPAGFGCTGGPAERTALNVPRGITSDGSKFYIADSGSNTIKEVDAASGNISTVAGTGAPGFSGDGGLAASAQLNHPTDVVYSGNTNSLYIADFLNFRVRQVDLASNGIRTIAGNGSPSLAGDGGIAVSAQLGLPYAVAVDAAGNEYVADNLDNAIRKVDASGVVTTVAGSPYQPPGAQGDGGPATAAQLNDPRGVAVDSLGNIFMSDNGNNRIRKVNATNGVITTFAGDGVAGLTGDGGLATSAKINGPQGLAFDANGNLYIADTGNNRVREVSTSNVITTAAGAGGTELSGPRGVAFNAAGDLFISDSNNNRIREVDHVSHVITTVAGTGVAGAVGDGGPALMAQLNSPFGLAFDGAGNLYVADTNNHRLRVIDTQGKISTVVGGCGAGYGGDGGPATIAHLNFPLGVAVDGLGNVLIADYQNNRIRGARGLLVGRAGTCPSAPGVAGPRGANPGFTSTGGTRVPDVGPRYSIDIPAQKSSSGGITIPGMPGHAAASEVPANRPVPIANGSETTPPHSVDMGRQASLSTGRAPALAASGKPPAGDLPGLGAIGVASMAILFAWMRLRRRNHRRKA